jgi:hypothetical protein
MRMRTQETVTGRRVQPGRGGIWGVGLAAFGALGCGVVPPLYPSPAANNYCTDFLRFAHGCSAGNTAGFLICLCITVTAGFLAAQLNNDQAREGFLRKNQSTFLFVFAVLAGVMGAYFHSRADAASSAAAEVQVALMNRDEGKRYDLCLGAASRWDGSLSRSLDAANAAAPKSDSNGTYQLADAVEKSGEVRGRLIHATESQGQVARTLLDALEKAIPPAKMSPQLRSDLAAARAKLDDVSTSIGSSKVISEDSSALVEKAKKTLRSADDDQSTGPKPTKTESSTDQRALPQGK